MEVGMRDGLAVHREPNLREGRFVASDLYGVRSDNGAIPVLQFAHLDGRGIIEAGVKVIPAERESFPLVFASGRGKSELRNPYR